MLKLIFSLPICFLLRGGGCGGSDCFEVDIEFFFEGSGGDFSGDVSGGVGTWLFDGDGALPFLRV